MTGICNGCWGKKDGEHDCDTDKGWGHIVEGKLIKGSCECVRCKKDRISKTKVPDRDPPQGD